MQFQDQIQAVAQAGFKSFVTLDYFFQFADNVGNSVRELFPPQHLEKGISSTNDYQKALRYFKLLSCGTKREEGMGLFETIETLRDDPVNGRLPKVKVIELTKNGKNLLESLRSSQQAA